MATISKQQLKLPSAGKLGYQRVLYLFANFATFSFFIWWLAASLGVLTGGKVDDDSIVVKTSNLRPPAEIVLLSRSDGVTVTTDVRGNLGPPSVMVQDPPGTDWLKDRWQAASDMHGTAIKGAHWVKLEFPHTIKVSSVVLDWEAAFSHDYQLQGSMDDGASWDVLFDTNIDADSQHRFESQKSGQSPGVKNKNVPLHVVHTITFPQNEATIQCLRVWIRSSAMGWGVSLWQVDVFGTSAIHNEDS